VEQRSDSFCSVANNSRCASSTTRSILPGYFCASPKKNPLPANLILRIFHQDHLILVQHR
jgi:hypothetical protein